MTLFVIIASFFVVMVLLRSQGGEIQGTRKEDPPPSPPPLPGLDPLAQLTDRWNAAQRRFAEHPWDATREAVRNIFATLMIVRPILGKELRTLFRSKRAYGLVLILVSTVGGYFLVFWNDSTRSVTFSERAVFSRTAFTTIFFAQFFALSVVSAVITSAAITIERENRTLDLLLATRFSKFEILLAKWFSAIIYQLILIISLMPILALSFQLGGIGNDEYWGALILTVTGVAAYGMIGLAFSANSQKTTTALMGALITVCALIFLSDPQTLFSGAPGARAASSASLLSDPGFVSRVMWHAICLAGAGFAASFGLARGDAGRTAVATRQIEDPLILEMRRKEWPYYLIDPLAKPQEIRDDQNPVFIKEQRTGFLAKLQVLIRLTYLGMFLSLIMTVAYIPQGAMADVSIYVRFALGFIMLFIPVLSSTAISREREEGTMDLLRVTLLGPRTIIRAKHFIALRFVFALGVSMMFVPFLTYISGTMSSISLRGVQSPILGLTAFGLGLMTLLAFSVLYASVGMLCSAFSQRNIVAIVSTYVILAVASLLPHVAAFFVDIVSPSAADFDIIGGVLLPFLEFIARYISPVVSPFAYYEGIGTPGGAAHVFGNWETWRQTLLHAGLLLALSWALSEIAAWRAQRDLGKS